MGTHQFHRIPFYVLNVCYIICLFTWIGFSTTKSARNRKKRKTFLFSLIIKDPIDDDNVDDIPLFVFLFFLNCVHKLKKYHYNVGKIIMILFCGWLLRRNYGRFIVMPTIIHHSISNGRFFHSFISFFSYISFLFRKIILNWGNMKRILILS